MTARSIPWDCAICGKVHEHWPDLARDVHFPTRASAQAMGLKISKPVKRPDPAPLELLDAMAQAAASCQARAAKCTATGLNDLAGAWTRCQVDLESTVLLRRKFDALPGPTHDFPLKTSLADQEEREVIDSGQTPEQTATAIVDRIENMFTGKLERPHEPEKKRRRRG